MQNPFGLIGFDADDTLWRSEDYYRDAQARFEQIVRGYLDDDALHERLYAIEKRNLALFGYGAKGMTLSMLETAIAVTARRISAGDLQRILELGKDILRHPVELMPHVRAAVEAIAARWPVVLITKGDLFHQEAKVRRSGLSEIFRRIEIVSEKDSATYARVLREFDLPAQRFVMVGNSLRSDIAPVARLGGWGVHTPYHVTWVHETEVVGQLDPERVIEAPDPLRWPDALATLTARATRMAQA